VEKLNRNPEQDKLLEFEVENIKPFQYHVCACSDLVSRIPATDRAPFPQVMMLISLPPIPTHSWYVIT